MGSQLTWRVHARQPWGQLLSRACCAAVLQVIFEDGFDWAGGGVLPGLFQVGL